jgi:hypothetical protein
MLQMLLVLTALGLTVGHALVRVIRWKRDYSSYALALALLTAGVIELLDWLPFMQPGAFSQWRKAGMCAEALLPLFWFVYCLFYSRKNRLRDLSAAHKVILVALACLPAVIAAIPADKLFYAPDFPAETVIFLMPSGYLFVIALLVCLVYPLVQLERTYLALPREDRWIARLEVLGVGMMLVTQIAYYGQGFLYRSINLSLSPARSVVLIAAVFLVSISYLRRGQPARIQVSKQLFFRSITLFVIGIYLVTIALIGEGLSYLGLDLHGATLLSIFILAGLALSMVLMSETLRRKIMVLAHKNFYEDKYDYRTQWLEFSKKVAHAQSEEQLYDTVIRLYCDTFAMVSGLMFVLGSDGERFECAANHGYPKPDFTLDASGALSRHFTEREWVLNVAEIPDELKKSEQELLNWMDVSFIIPLRSETQTLGVICLGPAINRNEVFYYEDFDLMKIFARQATASLQNVRLSFQISNLRELAAMGRVSTFVMHDLKNLVSNLALTADNAKEYLADAEFQEDLHQTLAITVTKMTDLISRLSNLKGKQHLTLAPVDLRELAEEAVSLVPVGTVEVRGGPVAVNADSEEMLKVFLNLIINGVEASEGDEPVSIELGQKGMAYFSVTDQGCGMTEQFIRESLFKPFVTTKKKGFGIGLYQCNQIVRAHGGTISVKSDYGSGSKFTVNLPLPKYESRPQG